MREARLGDIIDDFCIKCKRIMNHAVVSIIEDQPAKVRCRTCYNDHDYRHELAPPPKEDPRKAAALAASNPGAAPNPGAAADPSIATQAPAAQAPAPKAKGRKKA